MSSQPIPRLTPDEYLELERKADFKSEYCDGVAFAMGRSNARHVLIVGNVAGELGTQLKRRPDRVYLSNLRLLVAPTNFYTYPDVIVVSEEPQWADDQKDTLLNPTLIVEVLSESTKDYDRGGKFEHYRTLDSLQEYLLVAQDKAHVEHFVR